MDGRTQETRTRNHDSTCVGEPAPTINAASFGKATPHFPDGRDAARTLRWLDETQRFSRPGPAWSRSGSRQRLAQQLGVKDTNRRKDAFPAEHPCGRPPAALRGGSHAQPGERDRSGDSGRRPVHWLRHQLKTANFCRFSSLLQAFTHYDRGGKGSIHQEDLWTVCRQFQLPASGSVLDQLMDYCDADGDGLISFVEFANFLCWKDMMPVGSQEEGLLVQERQSSRASADAEGPHLPPPPRRALVRPEDLESRRPAGSLQSVRTLVKQRADPDQFRTTSALIGCSLEPPESGSSTCGVPSVRPPPRLRRLGDATCHGDASTAAAVLRPSVHLLHGVEEELLRPRSRKELSQIFRTVDPGLPEETFEEVWTLASAGREAGDVCVETICRLLKDMKAD